LAEENSKIVGPFGIWPFPFLNAIVQFILVVKSKTVQGVKKPKVYQFTRDERGRIIEILEFEG